MTEDRRSSPTAISRVVGGLLKNWGLARQGREQEVFLKWDEALGDQLARNAWPIEIHNGRLVVAVKDSVWMQELQFMKQDLKRKLNRALGPGVIREIWFKIGPDPRPAPDGSRAKSPPPDIELAPETVADARVAVLAIHDPVLRDQVLRTLLATARKQQRERHNSSE